MYLTSPGVQLKLAFSCARPAVLAAGKDGGMFSFFCFFTLIHFPVCSLSLAFISFASSSISFLPFLGR